MKANEFFKKVGIEAVKSYIVAYDDHLTDELKHLVESHELVEKLGGIKNAKRKLSTEQSEPYYNYSRQLVDSLKQAIADVESCQ